jgi:hypothetical protein
MLERAIRCFSAQTHTNRELVILYRTMTMNGIIYQPAAVIGRYKISYRAEVARDQDGIASEYSDTGCVRSLYMSIG